MTLFNTAGVLWSPALAGWGSKGGAQSQDLCGYYAKRLDGKRGALSKGQRASQTLNAWSIPSVYALYKGDVLVYVGKAGKLGVRLLEHYRNDHLVGRWDSFSWVSPWQLKERKGAAKNSLYFSNTPKKPSTSSIDDWLKQIESLSIVLGKPLDNSQEPGFGKHIRFLTQTKSAHASKTNEEKIDALYERWANS